MTKQELIDTYRDALKENREQYRCHRRQKHTAKDEEAAYHHDLQNYHATVMSMCSQFIKNLEEMEGNWNE